METVTAVALLIWMVEILGTLQLFYAGAVVLASVLIAAAAALYPAGGGGAGVPRGAEAPPAPSTVGDAAPTGPAGQSVWQLLVMGAVIAAVVFSWAVTTKHALDRGIFNFDSLWYHMPFAVEMVQNHSVTGMEHVETVFTNWFYPQNSELLHAVGISLTGRDTLSLFLNFGWLAVAFLAAWCIGRPYGRGSLTVVAAAILLGCHTLVVRDPGAAKNDLAAAALVLASIAILVEAWAQQRCRAERRSQPPADEPDRPSHRVVPFASQSGKRNHAMASSRSVVRNTAEPGKRNHGIGWRRPGSLDPGWAVSAAGLAAGLAAGTRVTALAMAAALSVAVIVLAPRGRRWAAAAWWFLPALAAGGYWYLRNLVVAGNPIPEVESIGPISLPHPERLQEGRPDFSILHYAGDTDVWRHYFAPGLHEAFGALWPLIVFGATAAALLAIVRGRDRIVRWVGGVALFGLLAYLVTPLSAAGAEGEPVGFGINIRYVIPALLAGIVLLPLPRFFDVARRRWGLMAALVLVFLVSDRPDHALHDKARIFALLVVVFAVLVPAALLAAPGRSAGRSGPAGRGLVIGGFAALVLAVVAIGYPLQRHYLDERFRNEVASESIPGMHLDSAYRWARGVEDARIGLAGTSAGFAGYGFYGSDLSNRVRFLGEDGPHGAFNAIPTCQAFRAAVNAADLDYLVTSPFLNFLHPDQPVPSPEARWLRSEGAVVPILHSGPVTVWEIRSKLHPNSCGAANAPLRQIPDTPGAG
ncbi:MAG TPA: hypothetical protein VGC49_09325 [Solirubrobacterales bacterium]